MDPILYPIPYSYPTYHTTCKYASTESKYNVKVINKVDYLHRYRCLLWPMFPCTRYQEQCVVTTLCRCGDCRWPQPGPGYCHQSPLLGNIVWILGAKFYNFGLYYSHKLFWKFNLKCIYMISQHLSIFTDTHHLGPARHLWVAFCVRASERQEMSPLVQDGTQGIPSSSLQKTSPSLLEHYISGNL